MDILKEYLKLQQEHLLLMASHSKAMDQNNHLLRQLLKLPASMLIKYGVKSRPED